MEKKIGYLFIILLTNATLSSAQQMKTSRTNILDVLITVTDTFVAAGLGNNQLQQKIDFTGPGSIQLDANDVISLRVGLDYQSKKNTTNYFSVSHDGHSIIGASAPVIIPPVKNYNGSSPLISPINPYPYIPDSTHDFSPFYNAPLQLVLNQYQNVEDYLADKNRISIGTITVRVNSFSPKPDLIAKNTDRDPFTIYPNPAKEYFNIEYNSSTKQNDPVQIYLYDMNGLMLSNVSLAGNSQKNTSTSYKLDMVHLKPGIYYCHILLGNEIYFKTLRKE